MKKITPQPPQKGRKYFPMEKESGIEGDSGYAAGRNHCKSTSSEGQNPRKKIVIDKFLLK
jgi:hypothetical protein